MKKAIIITVSILAFVALLFCLLITSKGFEIPKADKYPDVPYFPKISDSINFKNEALDTLHVINYYATDKSIFVRYSRTEYIYDTTYIAIVNTSFKNLAFKALDRRDRFEIDTVNQLLFIFKQDTLGNYLHSESINLKNGHIKPVKLLDENGFQNLKNQIILVKHATNASNDTDLLIFENAQADFFLMKGDEANRTAKTLQLTEDKNFNSPFGIKIGGDPEIKHQHINLFDKVVRGNRPKRLFSISTPSSNGNPNEDRMIKNAGYLENKGWFDKDRIYYFKMKLKTSEVKFKTDSYYLSDVFFDQLNTPKSDQDTLFYFSQNKIYKFFKVK